MYCYNPIFTSEEVGIERESFIKDDIASKGQSWDFDLGPPGFKADVIVTMPFSISKITLQSGTQNVQLEVSAIQPL